jgi:hypothetical protein
MASVNEVECSVDEVETANHGTVVWRVVSVAVVTEGEPVARRQLPIHLPDEERYVLAERNRIGETRWKPELRDDRKRHSESSHLKTQKCRAVFARLSLLTVAKNRQKMPLTFRLVCDGLVSYTLVYKRIPSGRICRKGVNNVDLLDA